VEPVKILDCWDVRGLIAEDEGEYAIRCPGCGCEYVHPTLVEVNAGGSITTVARGGTRMAAGEPAGRGVLIGLSFACEDGHGFGVELHFHKGTTGVGVHQHGAVPVTTIWRD
jgi:hypothetical protein